MRKKKKLNFLEYIIFGYYILVIISGIIGWICIEGNAHYENICQYNNDTKEILNCHEQQIGHSDRFYFDTIWFGLFATPILITAIYILIIKPLITFGVK